jgi:beta-glucosidase
MSVTLPPRVLREYELPAFGGPIEAGVVAGVMPAYNLVNGIPNHVHPLLSQLRAWRPDLVICSDAFAPSNLVDTEHYFADHAESHAAALLAGLDSFTDNDNRSEPTIARLTEALARGLITEHDIDGAVGRLLAMRCRLGEFHPEQDPYARTGPEVIACAAHAELAGRAARESVVLLKNADRALPWTGTGRVAVLGHLADRLLTDWYSGIFPYRVTVADGLREALGDAAVSVADGVDRIALRVAGTGRYVVPGPDGLAATGTQPVGFEHMDWGDGISTLRADGGRYVRVEADGRLVDSSQTPDGWVVRELLEPHPSGDGVRLRSPAADRWVGLDPAGVLRTDVTDPAAAARFEVELLRSGAEHAAELAAAADRVVVVLGNDPHINGRETQDRTTLRMPPAQEAVLRAAYAANPNTVLLLMSSYPYAIGWAADTLPAVLWMAHGGQEAGQAAADVLLGRYNPAGRLPQTWYADDADLGALDDYDIIGSRLTYLYHPGIPLFPFGHGLSYTTFGYDDLVVRADAATVTVTVRVSNTGDRSGDEVVQLYARAVRPSVPRPLRQLVGFTRVPVPAGESREVTFAVPVSRLAFWSEVEERYVVEPGEYEFAVSRSSADPAAVARLVLDPPRAA